MRGFWLLVHVLGFTLWLGGGIATMVAGVAAKRMGTAERLTAYKLIGAVQRIPRRPSWRGSSRGRAASSPRRFSDCANARFSRPRSRERWD